MTTMNERAARRITDTVLGAAMAPEVVVRVEKRAAGNLRFAQGQATTEGDVETLAISVTASIQGRTATAVGNRADEAALAALVAEAEELAALSPIDPEHMPPLGKLPTLKVDGHDAATAKLGAKQRAAAVEQALKVADDAQLDVAGFYTHHERSVAVATSAGAFCFWPSTAAALTTTCRSGSDRGSGWAAGSAHVAKRVDAGAVASLAAEKADMSREPEAIAPGEYVVVLEAQAVADLLAFLPGALDAREADEGRSFFSRPEGGSRVGEPLFHSSINLRSNPADPDHPAQPFADDGQAHKVVDWISDGVLTNLSCSRYWAKQTGAAALPQPSCLQLDGQGLELLELVGAIDRGVLVTRFWYNRMLERRSLLVTGLTRDGTFLIEQGKLTTALNNFRYNESPVNLLRNVLALGRPQRVYSRGRVMVVPPMVVRDFNFSSSSEAI
ncbi:TldD/PmbA family protein [Pseudenhygromyxa sp. WMMC2535]|uniref:metallopeptidase TldD-related protein n=1 Tax=Pseudenhygromyxa sp. WMMC2535 TaxID=2712867 RepID=UPI001556B558|nr:metallopeptidase TldD-related protein [Pseudenhygromyxa sp. WMMC2535]NVB41306.1 TldD/PmbA family protein [Pseudenhygromyxa sp. WMMC2535]